MNPETCTVTVYTQTGAISFEVAVTADDFSARLASALDNGSVILDTADGTKLVINAINVVAVEISETHGAE